MNKPLFTLFILLLSFSCYADIPSFISPPPALDDVRFEQHIGQKLPLELTFKDEYSQRAELSGYFGTRPTILVFTYFKCPNLCTLVLNGLVQSLKNIPAILGKDYQVLTLSVSPDEKPPLALAKRRSYLAKLGVAEDSHSAWHFLTGPKEHIEHLAKVAGFHYHRDPLSGEYAHPSGIIIVSPHGEISQYFFGIQYDPSLLHQALVTAAKEQKGSWVDEVLLYCFHYNPTLSRNGPLIMKAIRITGGLSVLCIFLFLTFLFSSKIRPPMVKQPRTQP